MNTEKHTYLIEQIFKTFFPGVEYVVEHENSLDYLYNIRLTNIVGKNYNPFDFDPTYKFENVDEVYTESHFINTFKGFAPTLSGLTLIYYIITHNGKSSVILTPTQTKCDYYGIIDSIKDPHRNRFENLY